jgi:two-component system, LytTR family, response regulator
LQKELVDLLLLDIEMPGLNGLSLLKSLEKPPKVILVTAYRDYALEGFELDVVDYLLKPVSFERFLKAVQKVLRTVPGPPPPARRSWLYFKSGAKMVQVFLEEINWVESMSNYARIFLSSGASVVTYQKMSDLETLLPAADFVRIHRSYIVRRDKVTAFTPHTVELGGKELPVGGHYKGNLAFFK